MPTNLEMVKLSIGLAVDYMYNRPYLPSLFKKALSVGGNAFVRDKEVVIYGYPVTNAGIQEMNYEFRDYLNKKHLTIEKDAGFIIIRPL